MAQFQLNFHLFFLLFVLSSCPGPVKVFFFCIEISSLNALVPMNCNWSNISIRKLRIKWYDIYQGNAIFKRFFLLFFSQLFQCLSHWASITASHAFCSCKHRTQHFNGGQTVTHAHALNTNSCTQNKKRHIKLIENSIFICILALATIKMTALKRRKKKHNKNSNKKRTNDELDCMQFVHRI